jgi:hypothetical protein
MRGTVLYGARDVRYEEVPEPKILKPTDAIIRLAATCVCGSDLWSYRGINEVKQPMYMGHEYYGVGGGPAPVRRSLQHLSYSLFGIVCVASAKVINNWRASWNTQRLAIRVSWFRDSASGL